MATTRFRKRISGGVELINVALDLRDPQRSGIARAATSIAQALLRFHSDEFSISLAGPTGPLRDLGADTWGASQIVDWREPRYSILGLGWRKAAAETGPALWYFPHWDVPLLAMRSPFVATVNDLAHLQLPDQSVTRRVIARRWIARTGQTASGLTAISDYTATQTRAAFPSVDKKLSVVPLAVAEEFFDPPPPLPPSLVTRLSGSRFMLSVGIRKERKNLRVGVDVLQRIPELRWVVVGEFFPEWQEVEMHARAAGVSDRMVVLERQGEETLRALYASAEFLLFPSRYEGFGLPILESLASGTPVIASRVTSVPEIVDNAGWLCDPDAPEAFVNAAREVLALGAMRAAMVARGKERARQFNWRRTANALARVLHASAARSALLKNS